MDESWMETWGLWAVLIGAILEGETVLIAAGYAISHGLLPAWPTIAVAIFGATLGDHIFYFVGRFWGARLFQRILMMRRVRYRASIFLRRWGRAAAFATRFAYGLRAALPMSMGASKFPATIFSPFNALGAVTFAMLYLSLGFFFGEAVGEAFARVAHFWVVVWIVGIGALIWAIREWWVFRSLRREDEPGAGEPEQ
jgi:membrane protein DedA with SNARE-associated domain